MALIPLPCPAHPAICARNAHRTVQNAPEPPAGTCPDATCPRRSYRAYGAARAAEIGYRLRGWTLLPRRLWLNRHRVWMTILSVLAGL